MSRILLGVSGGIAAYKALELVRLATGAGHTVRVVQTPASRRFVGAASFAALTGAPVLVDEFERDPRAVPSPISRRPTHEPIGHLRAGAQRRSLPDRARLREHDREARARARGQPAEQLRAGRDLPAAARAGDEQPHVRTPADAGKPEHPARARRRGWSSPTAGGWPRRASRAWGAWPSPRGCWRRARRLLAGVRPPRSRRRAALSAAAWRGLSVLVTAGGTREPIDSVRFIGNSSSGRMGLALAQAARARGAQVTLIAANVALPRPPGSRGATVAHRRRAAGGLRARVPACDVLLMAAAVADFRPAAPADGKIKKAGRERLQLELEPTPTCSAGWPPAARGQTLVGFAAEHGERALEHGARQAARQAPRCGRRQRHLARGHRLRGRRNEVTILTAAATQWRSQATPPKVERRRREPQASTSSSPTAHHSSTSRKRLRESHRPLQ